ncbi:MAG: signal recognition particle receptor subunit alpha, partial [Gemmatimonadota bacterium]
MAYTKRLICHRFRPAVYRPEGILPAVTRSTDSVQVFERLSDRLDSVLGTFRQRGVITPDMLQKGLREVRRALLEADVNYE